MSIDAVKGALKIPPKVAAAPTVAYAGVSATFILESNTSRLGPPREMRYLKFSTRLETISWYIPPAVAPKNKDGAKTPPISPEAKQNADKE